MTKAKEGPCKRCGERPHQGRGGLCTVCKGTCATCGGPTPKTEQGYHRTHCGGCRRAAETKAICSKCGKKRDGSHQSYCRSCYQQYSRDWGRKNPEKVAARGRRHHLKKEYGLTEADWNQMFAAQRGCCGVCGTRGVGGRGNRLHVDHNHKTGKVRMLLCSNCNVSIGLANEDPATLRALADYLESFAD